MSVWVAAEELTEGAGVYIDVELEACKPGAQARVVPLFMLALLLFMEATHTFMGAIMPCVCWLCWLCWHVRWHCSHSWYRCGHLRWEWCHFTLTIAGLTALYRRNPDSCASRVAIYGERC